MAEVKKQRVICPKCGSRIEVGIWDCIEMPYDMEKKESIMNQTFFKLNCDVCKNVFPIAYKCIYNDMEQKYMIWLVPRLGEGELEEINAYNLQLMTDNRLRLAQGGYRYRIVRNDRELREKVFIFDEGLDDRYIETMKTIYVPVIQNKIPDNCKIMGVYFHRAQDGDGYQLVVVLDNQPPMSTRVNMDIYEDMKNKLHTAVEEKTTEGLMLINANWAVDIMTAPADNGFTV